MPALRRVNVTDSCRRENRGQRKKGDKSRSKQKKKEPEKRCKKRKELA